MFDPEINTVFLDGDGVLADYEAIGNAVFGMHTRDAEQQFGTDEYYRRLNEWRSVDGKRFFQALPVMAGALSLYWAVEKYHPVILSGIPWQIPTATMDKVDWFRSNISPDVTVITPRSRDKYLYCKWGDIIIDDWPKHKQKWLDRGGIWIEHTDAVSSIDKLRQVGVEIP